MQSVVIHRMSELAECVTRMAQYGKQFNHNFSEEITVANEVKKFVTHYKEGKSACPKKTLALYEDVVASLGNITV